MAQQELNFEYYGNELTATIDNQALSLDVYKIVKFSTHFILHNNLDTVLNAPIDIDLFLGYDENNEDIIGIEKGFVNLKLMSVSKQTIYQERNINFVDGQINTQFVNNLNIGEYILQVDYLGSKYYEPTSLTIQFSISQREIKCIFADEYIQAYPNENISIGVTLVDNLNGKKINNCLINYYFNNFKYITQTNDQGYALLNITMPNIDPNICPKEINTIIDDDYYEYDPNVIYFDYDDNIQYITNNGEEFTQFTDDGIEVNNNNIHIEIGELNEEDNIIVPYSSVPKYTLEIGINSTIYKLVSETYIDIFIKKYNTEISYIVTNDNYLIHIEGDVLSYNDNQVSNVQYGTVSFDIAELPPHPQSIIELNDDGHFVFEKEITQTENANVPASEPILYSPTLDTITEINIVGDTNQISRDYIDQHKISFIATTKTGNTSVAYGMMTFIIMRDYKEIYRYVTEMNINGEANFNFDVSTIGEYQVKAIYHGMFEYQSSESDIKEYKVIEAA